MSVIRLYKESSCRKHGQNGSIHPFFFKSFFFLACPNEACGIDDLIKMEKSNFAIINIKKF